VLPTETVYGLAALPAVPGATGKIFALKGRGADTPLAVLCAGAQQALALADEPSDAVHRVANELWPGPLTLVLRRRSGLNYGLGEPATTIGVRCPDHDLVRMLAAEVGPIAATSANRHGQPTPDNAGDITKLFGDRVAAVVDGGPCEGLPSTVVDATDDDPANWTVIRQGALTLDEVRGPALPQA